MKKLLVSLLMVFSLSVHALPVEFTWDTPQTRVDGKPLRTEEISKYVLEYGNSRVDVQGNSVVVDLPRGTTTARIRTVDTLNQVGPYSPDVSVYVPDLPSAPTNFTYKITIELQGVANGN